MTLSPRFKDAFKIALAMVIAHYIALSMDWGKPMWAGFAVAVISGHGLLPGKWTTAWVPDAGATQ